MEYSCEFEPDENFKEEEKEVGFMLENVEQVSKQVINQKLEDQRVSKLQKAEQSLQKYQGKLAHIREKLIKNPQKKKAKYWLKEAALQVKVARYQSIISKINEDFRPLDDDEEEQKDNANEEYLSNTFAPEARQQLQNQLLEITIEGEVFCVQELFHKLLFPHQQEALNWLLYQHVKLQGAILADEMGLGKTISAIALIVTLVKTKVELAKKGRDVVGWGPFLIVCPATVVRQWIAEIHTWTESVKEHLPVYTLYNEGSAQKKQIVKQVYKNSGILVISYELLRIETSLFSQRPWQYCILDEGQKIKNCQSQTHASATSLLCQHRLILSGTPMQNSLSELWSLFNFVQPGLLGELDFFENTYCKAILQGGYTVATKVQQETAKELVAELRHLIHEHILRRTKKQLKIKCELPERNEFVVFCNLTDAQLNLYNEYLGEAAKVAGQEWNKNEALGVLANLRKICNHPFLFFAYGEKVRRQNGPGVAFFTKIMGMSETKIYQKQKQRFEMLNPSCDKKQVEGRLAHKFWQFSGKLQVLDHFLSDWHSCPGTKVLLFSQTKKMLDVIEQMALSGSMRYLRMDGDVPLTQRMQLIDQFNKEDVFLFLLTTRVGGLGINLTAANKVVVFDPDWNPMVDVQATERALRIGQKRDVTIYRFVVDDTIEEKIYHRQIFKKYLSDKILQDPSKRRLFEKSTLHELFDPPKRAVNFDKLDRLLSKFKDAPTSLEELEKEIVEGTACEREQKSAQKMYQVSKRAVKEDPKLKAFAEKTIQELKRVDEAAKKVKKDLESDLITNIFKQQNAEDEEQKFENGGFNLAQLNVKLEAMQEAGKLIGKLKSNRQEQLSSASILMNIKQKQALQQEVQNKRNEDNSDASLEDQILNYYQQLRASELTTDDILEQFPSYVTSQKTHLLKSAMKNVAYFDPIKEVWILK